MFKIYNCDFGFKRGGVSYDFEHVAEVQIENAERNKLTRGANATNKVGLVYKEGLTEPKRMTLPVLDIPIEMANVMREIFETQERIDFYCVDRTDGSSFIFKQAILCNDPIQTTIDETAESMQIPLEIETFDYKVDRKS